MESREIGNATSREILQRIFLQRVDRNPRYSLRAFASSVGVSHTYLSLVLNGKKALSRRTASAINQTLTDTHGLGAELVLSVEKECRVALPPHPPSCRKTPEQYVDLELDKFVILNAWHHLAILEFTLAKGFQSNAAWIAKRLGIKVREVRSAVDRLERLGLLVNVQGNWKKANDLLTVPVRRSETAVQRFHRQMILKALDNLKQADDSAFRMRDISSTTVVINPNQLKGIKSRSLRLRRQLTRHLTRGECTELYQMNIQIFPLTKKEIT